MRPATAHDQAPIAAMIRARSAWMRKRAVDGWDCWESSAGVLAAQAADPAFPVWAMTDETDRVVGCTTVYDESPSWSWTDAERCEPAFFLATTVTDPRFAGQRLGCEIVWWVLDLAAREGRTWVRRSTTEPRLVRYYRDVQGWSVVREMRRDGQLHTGLSRRAQLQPRLPVRSGTAYGSGVARSQWRCQRLHVPGERRIPLPDLAAAGSLDHPAARPLGGPSSSVSSIPGASSTTSPARCTVLDSPVDRSVTS